MVLATACSSSASSSAKQPHLLRHTIANAGPNQTFKLTGPSLKSWRPRLKSRAVHADWKPTHTVRPTELDAHIYTSPTARHTLGHARPGVALPAREVKGSRCWKGRWYEVRGGGFVCTTRGFSAKRGGIARARITSTRLAGKRSGLLPFRYAKIKRSLHRAARLKRVPSGAENKQIEAAITSGKRLSSIVTRWMEGAFFVPLVRKHIRDGVVYYEHTNGEYVRAKDVEVLKAPPMQGVHLDDDDRLPIAFVLESIELSCLRGNALVGCGAAKKHARFEVAEIVKRGGRELVRSEDGFYAPLDKLRIARRIEPPKQVPAKARWVHFDLEEQVLVAYEGAKPVFTTLFSSGAKGHETPTGLYQVSRKYLSKTMAGPDDDVGWYEVGEVPWTMFYHKSYAVHGAYWHNRFGYTKSHGCTNLAPADARWLFYWGSRQLPGGWHSILYRAGTWFYFTDGEDDE